MRQLLLSISLALAAVSANCFATDRVTDNVKPRKGKASYESVNKSLLQSGTSSTLAARLPQPQASTTAKPKALIYDSPDGTVDFHAFSFYDMRIRSVSAMVEFNTGKPNDYKLVRDFAAEGEGYKYVGAATYVGDKVYAYTMSSYPGFPGVFIPPISLCEVDVETGNMTQVADLGGNVFSDLAYDPVSGCLYALYYQYSQEPYFTEIYRFDPNDLKKVELAARFENEIFFTMAADNGWIYVVAKNIEQDDTELWRFNPSTIEAENGVPDTNVEVEVVSNSLGLPTAAVFQDMEFDKNTHRLFWWAQIASGSSIISTDFIEIDPADGAILSSENIQADAQLVGLCTPYQQVNDAAPTLVTGLKATADAQGGQKATIEWINPSANYQKGALAELSGVEIFRDGVSVAKVTSVSPGKKSSWADNSVVSGNHVYRVQPYNGAGAGVYKEVAVFVGHDLPAAPANVRLTANGSRGTVTWTAPARGENGGWIDVSTLAYDITRMPDQTLLESDFKGTTYTDNVEELRGYYYEITAKNADGVGGTAQSNILAYGPDVAIPFISSMKTQAEFDLWMPVDNNHDGTTWVFSPYTYTHYVSCPGEADDYLFSPPLKLEAGKQYQVRYSYDDAHYIMPGTMEPVNERLAVHYGTERAVTGLNCIASHDEVHNLTGKPLMGKALFTAKENTGHVAFQCWSEPDKGVLFLTNVSIREYSDKDVSFVSLNGSLDVNYNVEQTFNVVVGNEGKSPVSGYKVVLCDALTKEVLGEASGGEIGVGETAVVPVKWTPKAEGDMEVAVRVELEGDTYPADNESAENTKVKVNAQDADKILTINKYNTYGWAYPFYFNFAYNQNQAIHHDSEIPMKNIFLTGAQFVYNNKETMAEITTAVRISIMPTEQKNFIPEDDGSVALIEGNDWVVVYEGDITVDKMEDDVKVYIPFDTKYKYSGGNIAVKYERLYESGNGKVVGPCWQYYDYGIEDGGYRMATYRTNNANEIGGIIPEYTDVDTYTPYTGFSYQPVQGGIEETLNMGTEGFSVTQSGTEIRFNVPCEKVEIFDTSGAFVASAKNTDRMSITGLQTGVYVVRALVGGKPAASKFVIP